MYSKFIGLIAENDFKMRLEDCEFDYSFSSLRDWDIEIYITKDFVKDSENKINVDKIYKIEIKSCNLFVTKYSNHSKYNYPSNGFFIFKNKKTRDYFKKVNMDIALYVTFDNECLFLGIIPYNTLNPKNITSIPLKRIYKFKNNLLTLEKWYYERCIL